MILLDTVVLSELRKRRPSGNVVAWLRERDHAELFLSVITLGEIERGIRLARARDAAFADALARWLDELVGFYGDRILPVTMPIARRWGEMSALLGHDGADLMIAATALVHRLAVATRNVRHFEGTGVAVIDPFSR